MQNRGTFYSRIVIGLILMPLALFLPRMRRKMVFGAWFGDSFSDNPKYFLKYMLSIGGWQCIWIGHAHLKEIVGSVPGVEFVKKGSVKALWHCLTAKYFVNNIIWMDDIMAIPTCGRVIQINLWHGTALKRIGGRQYAGAGEIVKTRDNRSFLRKLLSNIATSLYDFLYPLKAYSSSGSKENAKVLVESWPQMFAYDRLVVAGQPRCDYLLQNRENSKYIQELKRDLASRLGVPAEKRWYLYLPTWRHGLGRAFSFLKSDRKSSFEKILLADGAVILEKQHPKVLSENPAVAGSADPFYVISPTQSRNLDVQELLLVSDRLITDYSSCYFDFELLRRPIIHFDYDYDNYINSDSGVEYNPLDVAGGPVVHNEEDLLCALSSDAAELLAARGEHSEILIDLETGHASHSLYNIIPK